MAEINLQADTGRSLGSGPSKRLRVEGKVPGVVYGMDADPTPVTVDWRPLREVLTTDAGLNVLIDLKVDGDVSLCMVKELQRHPIRGDVIHIDFLRVDRDAAIVVEVPIVLEGEARAVLNENASVDHILFALSISAKPADIPNEIVYDISEMTLEDTIRVGDLELPPGVTTEVDPEEPVATTALAIEEEEPEEEETEGDEEAAAEGAAPAEGADEG